MRVAVWALLALLVLADDAHAGDRVRLKAGQSAPKFVLPVMNPAGRARTFKLKDYVGAGARRPRRAVVLTFAASYCEPCKAELVELKRRAPELAAAGVTLAVVVIDTEKEGIERMRALTVDKLRLPYPVLADRFGVLARRYGAVALPMAVLMGGDGVIRWVQTGYQPGSVDRLVAKATGKLRAAQGTARGRAPGTARGRAAQGTARGRAAQGTARGRAAQGTARGRAAQGTARGRAQGTARGRAADSGVPSP